MLKAKPDASRLSKESSPSGCLVGTSCGLELKPKPASQSIHGSVIVSPFEIFQSMSPLPADVEVVGNPPWVVVRFYGWRWL